MLVRGQPISPTSLMLNWDPPLQEVRNGIIQRYTIWITELETGQSITLTSESTTVNVTSLHPYYTYNCSVAAETTAIGPFSSPIVIQLPESGMYIWNMFGVFTLMLLPCSCKILTAPSSSPSNVSTEQVTSTSFTLSWMAPPTEDHNGVIRHYIVRCTEQDHDRRLQRVTANSTTQRIVDSLHPFYNYSCTVAAVTVAEGPYSSKIAVTTAQDGDHCFTMIVVGFI